MGGRGVMERTSERAKEEDQKRAFLSANSGSTAHNPHTLAFIFIYINTGSKVYLLRSFTPSGIKER